MLQRIKGVDKVVSGYTGGSKANPTYQEVCTGTTNHVEVCHVTFDPNALAYKDLLTIFFNVHNPTTLNRQGNDVGTQYKSAIFYTDEQQKQQAYEVRD